MVPTDFVPTLEELKTSVAAQYRSRFPTKAHDRDSFFGKTTSAVAMSLLGFIKRLKNVAANQVPGWDNDQLGAASWGESIGIPSNNPNSRYGPNLARPASGGVGLAKGTPASVINDGTSLVNTTGQVYFKSSGAAVIGAGGTVLFNIVADTPGVAGNLAVGEVLQFVVAPPGVQPQVTLQVGLAGGEDDEARESVIDRTLTLFRSGKRGGTPADVRRWSENYLNSQGISPGYVKRAWVYPLRGGLGTYHVVIGGAGSGLSRLLTIAIADAVKAFLQLLRVPATQIAVLLPDMSRPGRALSMRVKPTPVKKYAWSTSEFSLTVTAVPSASQATIGLNLATTAIPALVALRAAIDAGRKPLVQVTSQNSVLPVMVRVVSYTNAVNSVLTFDEAPATGIAVNDILRAGSEVVLPVAQALLDHVNSLGPSRQSGYADPFDGWNDTIGIGALEGRASNVVDPVDTQTKLVADVAETTIDGLPTNVTARDVLVGGTPELLYVANGGIVILPLF